MRLLRRRCRGKSRNIVQDWRPSQRVEIVGAARLGVRGHEIRLGVPHELFRRLDEGRDVVIGRIRTADRYARLFKIALDHRDAVPLQWPGCHRSLRAQSREVNRHRTSAQRFE